MIFAISALIVVACGQKGPPLPPLVRIPVAPVVTADRRGSAVELNLTVPSANTDGSRPANLVRIDIYAVNGASATMTDAEVLKFGTKIASVPVKSPRNPNDVAEKGESTEDTAPAVGDGLDQGSSSAVVETISTSILESLAPRSDRRKGDASVAAGPLLGPPAASMLRTYVGVGVDRRGRPGQFSARVAVPLELSPAPPPPIAITYDEHKIAVTWTPPAQDEGDSDDLLPSRSLGPLQPDLTYNLYDGTTGQRLTKTPVKEFSFEDTRMDFGTKRCYVVRSVAIATARAVESDPTGPTCEMLVDTFAPAVPKELKAVATAGAISLIWDANAEPDLAGYHLYRAIGAQPLIRITAEPVTDLQFVDGVQAGLTFTYAVSAVDKAGNESPRSAPVEETAR